MRNYLKPTSAGAVSVLRLCGCNAPARRGMAQLLQATSALSLITLLSAGAALAQTFTVPNGGPFSGTIPPNPSDGSTIDLQGATATGDVAIALPTGAAPGTADLTINGAAGGSTVTIVSGTFGTNGTSLFTNTTGNPVILNLTGGPITFTGADISGDGGVLSTTGTVSIAGALTADANTAFVNGGAISANNGSVSLAETSGNVALANNNATSGSGGAVWAAGDVTIGHAGGTTTLTGNTANVNGGAIYTLNSGDAATAISITGALTADGNRAIVSGGALFTQSGDIVQDGGDVVMGTTAANKATSGHGGAIYADNGSVSLAATAGDVTLANNSAGRDGGAIWASRTVTIGHVNGATTLADNVASGSGGAIYASNGGAAPTAISITGALTATGNTAGRGGALYAVSGDIVQDGGDVILGGSNAADGNKATDSNGGAIYAFGGNVSLAATSGDVTIANNSADGVGGAIYASGTVTLGNASGTTTLTKNAAGNGGAIFAGTGLSIAGNLTADSNTAAAGGVIYTNGSVNLAATSGDVALENNSAGNGGAIWAVGSVALGNAASTTTLTNNSASQFGGAIYTLNSSISVIGNLTANGNTATFGGALYARSGDVVQDFGDVHIGDTTANKATAGSGGAIFANSGSVSLAATAGSVSLVNNTATFDGGAIAALGNVTTGNTGGTLVLSHNSAGQNGGAIWSGSNVTLWGTDISNNTAVGNGGAIYAAGDYTLNATTNDTIASNSAGLLGGAIWAGGNVTLNATGGDIIFFGNKQNTTGTTQANAIYLDNSATTPATLTLNTAGHTIDFADPVLNNAANGLVSVTATGGGAVGFEGTLYTSQADRWSKLYGNTTVNGGTTFIVAGNAIYGALASDVGQAAPTSFTANSGALIVVGTGGEVRADSLAVNNGSRLVGDGTVTGANIAIDAGGILMPGDGTPGTAMTINGNLTMSGGSTYQVQINPTTAALANVNGTADLTGGTVNAVYANGGYISKKYTILTTTGGLGGTHFAGLTNTNLPANFHDSLSYDANNAYLDLALNFSPGPDYGGGLNRNQQNVADALTGYFDRNNGIPSVYGTLSPNGLTQVSGELGTTSQQTTYQAMNLFMGLITDPFSAGRGVVNNGPTAYADDSEGMAYARSKAKNPNDAFAAFTKALPAVFAQRWNVWAAGYGGSQTTAGNAVVGSNNTTSSVYGGVAGADYWFSLDTVAGFALGGGGSNFSVANGGSGRSDLFQAGAFVRHNFDATYVTASVAYGWQDVNTDRYVSVAGVDHLRANFNANAYSGRLELGHRFVTPWFGGLGVSPYAAAQITAFELPSYAERALSGASTFALNYGGDTTTSSRTELGLRTDKSYALDGAVLTLRGRAAWAHDYDPHRSIAATFQSLPGASFVVNGAALASDSALTTASAEVRWLNGWSVAATFEGEFSDVTHSFAGKGVVRYAW